MLFKNITRICKEKGIAISRLERECGISNGTIGRWGTSSPTVENVRKVAKYLDTTVDALLGEQAEKEAG